ncbi:MAG: hypothetical protein H7Y37_20225 [Anaerolineae bacterium]|nr:hypothetical protein [Gloeobacterales cyanobacterium ES-bin-313]
MKWNKLAALWFLVGVMSVSGTAVTTFSAQAQEVPLEKKISLLTKNKDQVGTGDMLRRFFYGDLLPLGVQPGGAGMVVNLYSKTSDYTFSYCATYDVVVAIKKGRITQFPADEVK